MNPSLSRAYRFAAQALLVSSAAITFIVIPMVRRDTFSGARPDSAAGALWVVAIISVSLALTFLAAYRRDAKGLASPGRAGFAAVLSVLLGLLLIDAATAFAGHGPAMLGAVFGLWLSVVLDLVAGCWTVGAIVRHERASGRRNDGVRRLESAASGGGSVSEGAGRGTT